MLWTLHKRHMHDTELSKFLSLILRHKPETIGLTLDDNGWADIGELIEKLKKHEATFDFERLETIVENSDKKRFAFSADYSKIRANQGHSINVDLNLKEGFPPDILYHGTAVRNLESIKADGLLKKDRHHVHLSKDKETAKNVGARYGKPIILVIDSKQMIEDGIIFYLSENDVWLTDFVAAKYIDIQV